MNTSASITSSGNIIYINDLSSPHILKRFASVLKTTVYKKGYQDIVIDVNTNSSYFPNVLVPVCGIIEHFIDEGVGIDVLQNGRSQLRRLITPYNPAIDIFELSKPLSKIWRFTNTQEICDIQKSIISELRKEDVFADGVLEGIEWSINEIMDNVLNHSQAKIGFIMSQLHKTTKHVAFTIFDSGIGIFNSFKHSDHKVRSVEDALTICLQEGVTRDSKIGQGNGMCGLFSLIKEGNGILNLSSGLRTYSYVNGVPRFSDDSVCSLSSELGCTTVDFQLDYSLDISIDKVLTFQGKTFSFTNLFTDDLEDEFGVLHFSVSDMSEGTGTRESALRLKNQIINSVKGQNKRAVIDFEGVNVVSSSYIDELLAKIFIEIGLFQFNKRISLQHMSPILQKTLQKSVIQRIIEDYKAS